MSDNTGWVKIQFEPTTPSPSTITRKFCPKVILSGCWIPVPSCIGDLKKTGLSLILSESVSFRNETLFRLCNIRIQSISTMSISIIECYIIHVIHQIKAEDLCLKGFCINSSISCNKTLLAKWQHSMLIKLTRTPNLLTLKRKYKKLTLNEIWGQFDPKTWLNLTKLV